MEKPNLKLVFKVIAIMCISTIISIILRNIGLNETNIVLIFLLGVLFSSISCDGHMYGVIASFLGVLLFNYFFTKPYYTLFAESAEYPVTFITMLTASLITSKITSKMKKETRESQIRENRINLLYTNNKKLLRARNKNQIIEFCGESLANLLERTVIITIVDTDKKLQQQRLYVYKEDGMENIFKSSLEKEAIKKVLHIGEPAGIGTNFCKSSSAYYLPIKGQNEVWGVIGVACFSRDMINENEKTLLASVSTQVALAIEREELSEKHRKANIDAETERLRSNLLRSISHDLRTPLTSILGSVSTIIDNEDFIDKDTRKELLENIYEDASWLTHSVENILSMTRIDEGILELNKKVEIIDDIIGESIKRVNKFNNNHNIKVNLPEDIIVVKADGLLIEHVIVNLVDNAIRYTPTNSNININVYKEINQVIVEVSDDGDGIDKGDIDNIFNRFYTKSNSRNLEKRGVGLGLSICKSIVNAHDGDIIVFNNEFGGATFKFNIPLEE